jgi:LuxR family maltose regulon positive regulatory protein
VVSAQNLLEVARCYASLGDTGGAGAVLRRAQDIFHQRRSLGNLPRQAAELHTDLLSQPGAIHGASSLTTAELRLLPLLATHLTLSEIGERLHVNRNPMKTQAFAIYRKFGVSSGRAAISPMHELGLLRRE